MNELGLSRPAIAISIVPQVQRIAFGDRQVMIVRGWVASAGPVAEVSIVAAGEFAGRITYGASSSEPSFIQTGDDEREYGFVFNLNNLPRRVPRELPISIVARSENGGQYQQEFVLEVERSFAWLRGAPRTDYPVEITAPVLLFVERAAIEANQKLVVTGWAAGLSPIVAVQIFDSDGRIGAARIGLPRFDVAETYSAYPGAPSSGFIFVTPLASAVEVPTQITVQAIDRSGRAYDMPVTLTGAHAATAAVLRPSHPPPADDESRRITLHVDEASLTAAGWLTVAGWCVSAANVARLSIFLDGEELGDAELGRQRTDVGKAYSHIPGAGKSGYRFYLRASEYCEGEYQLRLLAENGTGDSIDVVVPVQVEETDDSESENSLPAEAGDADYKLHLDLPVLVNGVVREAITNRLSLNGWAIDRAGVERIEVDLDGASIGTAFYGQRRDDLATAFPNWTGALLSGYALQVPSHMLKRLEPGLHTIDIRMRSKSGAERRLSFAFNSERLTEQPESPLFRTRMTEVERDLHERTLDGLGWHPHFHIALLTSAASEAMAELAATLASLRWQAYTDWTLHVLVRAESACNIVETVRVSLDAAGLGADERVSIFDAADPEVARRNLADNLNGSALLGVLSAGDVLGCDALIEMAIASGLDRQSQFFYSDESRLDLTSRERQPFFKPDWSPDLLLSTNYIGRFWCVRTDLLQRLGATLGDLTSYGEYDFVLRCTEAATKIGHLPKLLCRRSWSTLEEPDIEAQALARALFRRGTSGEVLPGAVPGTYRVRRHERAGTVSIIIPTIAAHGHIERCIDTIRAVTAYRDYEIVLVDNIHDQASPWKPWFRDRADKVVELLEPFNWSRFNNIGATAAKGQFLLFLNDDMEAIAPDWLECLLEHATRPEIAVVGPQLLYAERKVQHAGQFLVGLGRSRHAFRYLGEDEPGYFGLARTTRNCIAVTGACMMIRREVFEELGRFDETHAVVNNDMDFCLRAHKAGRSIVYTAESRLIHHELSSRAELKDIYNEARFAQRWGRIYAAGDPFFSPHLSKEFDDFGIEEEPAELVYCGHPVYRRQNIKRILAVKLDHIGDFMTCLPAFRRIRTHFPQAELYVLAGGAARTIAPMEPSIKGVIEFEFFHSKSGLGKKQVTQQDLRALEQRLLPYGFDLAIDLRKHLETRPVLRHTGARVLAGYDQGCQFPWLDIALEWESDERLRTKRTHITDDLLRLVDAVATAGESDRTGILPTALPDTSAMLARLPFAARRLFRKRVVGMHCGAGQELKQWPAEHFAALIDLLIERHDVNVVLTGSPDEKPIATQVLERVQNRRAVVSLVGKTALGDLPALLNACALFVGNDSGPKHIAAGLGVPTVGIHAGSVDSGEWGPAGPLAVAIRRNMSCSPCYLSELSDCHRSHGCMRGLSPGAVYRVCQRMLPLRRAAEAARRNRPSTI